MAGVEGPRIGVVDRELQAAGMRRKWRLRRADGDVEEIDGRGADETRNEAVGRMAVDGGGVPTCWTSPSRMITTRSPSVMASTWSWVTNTEVVGISHAGA